MLFTRELSHMCRGSDEICVYSTRSQLVTNVGIGRGNDFLQDLRGQALVSVLCLAVPSPIYLHAFNGLNATRHTVNYHYCIWEGYGHYRRGGGGQCMREP